MISILMNQLDIQEDANQFAFALVNPSISEWF